MDDRRGVAGLAYLLFYAGSNKVHEQIGLAVSEDGRTFERAGAEPIVPVAPRSAWRDLRTCNPAVVRAGAEFLMYFQGVSREGQNVAIARARSRDARDWTVDPEPCVSWRDLGGGGSGRAAVFEPSVLVEHGRYRMWFMHLRSPEAESHQLLYAESADGESWAIERSPLLSGDTFGFCWLHYPQVLPTANGYELYFTLRSRRTRVDAIYRATSPDGLTWRGAEPVLRRPFRMVRSRRSLAAKALHRLAARVWPRDGAAVLGYSHPHVLREPGRAVMYIHNDNHGPRGRWYDISRYERSGSRWRNEGKVLSPSASPGAWDTLFVADPYVIVDTPASGAPGST